MISEARREYLRKYQRDRYRRRKKEIIGLMGGACCVCGSSFDLEIHHSNPSQKGFDPGSRGGKWSEVTKELEKCELLCSVCHKKKHATSHGKLRMYTVYGCRCGACVNFYRDFKTNVDKRFYERLRTDPERLAKYREKWRQTAAKQRQKCKVLSELGIA